MSSLRPELSSLLLAGGLTDSDGQAIRSALRCLAVGGAMRGVGPRRISGDGAKKVLFFAEENGR